MNILVDSRYKSIVPILDRNSNIVIVDVEDLGLSSNDLEGIEPMVEMVYTKCVDKSIDVVVTTAEIRGRLAELGLEVRYVGGTDE